MYQETTALQKIQRLHKRIRGVQGGTSASKTISILIFLIVQSQKDERPRLTSIVSESFPHLRRGVEKDFIDIMQTHKWFDDSAWNKSSHTYTFPNGSIIEFFSVDQPGKVRGPRRDRLFMNEANNISYDAFEQLEVRTNDFIIADWNPVSEFWFHTEINGKRSDAEMIILTYRDNEACPPNIVQAIEQRKSRAGWWKVFGEGQIGEIEGKIYSGWQIVPDIPFEARLERYGMDFGYTNDPTAIVGVYYYDGGYILDEVAYQNGLKNPEIASLFKNMPRALVVADSAEPKSIDEIKSFGITIVPTQKGADSIRYGCNTVANQKISVTSRSVNLIKEYRNYLWKVDRDGVIMRPEQPEDGDDHCMDAIRYAMTSLIPIIQRKEYSMNLPRPRKSGQMRINPAR